MTAAPPVLFGPAGFLRSLRGDEAPYPGDLHASTARGDEDASHAVWVDAGLIAEQVWRCDPNGHVLAPIDVARTPSGQAAVLPHCPHRLGVHVEAASRAGEVVTIAVSMLRGAGEASEAGIVCGAWWVDEAGRPVLAAVGSQAWREEGAALLTALATAAFPPLQDALEGAARAMAHDLVSPDELRACEDALFDAADPRPLGAPGSRDADGSMAPRSVVSLRVPASSDPEPSAGSTAGRWLARFTDVEWAGRVTGAIAEVRRVVATPRARRRRTPWITAAVVGLVVVAGGMLWPEGEPAGGVAPHPPTGAAAATSAAAPRHSDAEPLPTDDSDDSDDRIGAVLTALAKCAEAATTCADMREDPAAPELTGAVVSGVGTASLLDEYGGVAVYRIEADGQPAQVLVLVEADAKWLVRDVYDVADQP